MPIYGGRAVIVVGVICINKTVKAEFIPAHYRWEGCWSWMCKTFNQPVCVHVCGISHGGHHGRLWRGGVRRSRPSNVSWLQLCPCVSIIKTPQKQRLPSQARYFHSQPESASAMHRKTCPGADVMSCPFWLITRWRDGAEKGRGRLFWPRLRWKK